jgi:Trk K+ transport system NAD-binding subunit
VYEAINLQPVNPVVILTESDLKNRQIATILKNDLGHQNLIAVANRKQNIQQLRANGIQAVDIPNTLATAVENRLFMPQTYYSIFDSFSTYGIREVLVQNANVEGKRIDDLDFPDEGFMMMIKKSTGIHVPHPTEVLENGDVAVIFGSEQALQVLEDRLGEPGQAALPES